ncbi:MAG: hypothetical protein AAF682_08995 [Planctomycetota bacterium]
MRFFRSLNFPRAMILGSLIGAAIIGYLAYQRTAELKQLETDLKDAPFVVKSIQMKAKQLDDALKAANREGLSSGQDDPEYYIRQRAQVENVGIGQVDINPSKSSPAKDVEDLKFKIRPTERSTRFLRGSIANFLYKLEQDSRRVKVTSIKIDPIDKLKPGEISDDYWTFEAELTSRRKVEG